MTKRSIYLLPKLLLWSLLWGILLPSVWAQSPILESRVDSNCMLHVRLVDSTGSVAHAQAPYLLQVNQLQSNSNAIASWQIDLSNETALNYDIRIVDANQNQYRDSINASCGLTIPPSSLPIIATNVTGTLGGCSSCNGSGSIRLTNPNGSLYSFTWSDGFVESDTATSIRGNLCAGTYTVVVSDSFGNHNSATMLVVCGAAIGTTCFPSITRYLDRNGKVSISPQDVRTGSTFPVNIEHFVDAQDNISRYYQFDCSDVGYQYLTLVSQDSLTARHDTCQVLVEIIDTLNYCGAYSNTVQVADSSLASPSCNVCNGYYSFDYLIRPVTRDTLYPQDLNFYWSDTSFFTSTRFDLCPNTPYQLTVVDNANQHYQYTINVGCNNNSCVNVASIPPYSYCPEIYIPVCGCDGVTYKNACVAEYEFGVSNWTLGGCPQNNLQITFNTSPDSSACDTTSLQGTGSAFVRITGGSGSYIYSWNTGQTGPSINNMRGGTYLVTITDSLSGFSTFKPVIIGTQGCVWPGDTDDNGVANNFDLLPIGLAYGTNGPPRATISTAWQGFTASPWLPTGIPLLANARHIDCNGDGSIDSSDVQAIQQNYSQSYARSSTNSLLGTIPFYVESGQGAAGDSVETNIILGDSINPAVNVYGIAFTINYDPNYLERDPVQVDFSNSWLGNNLLQVQKDVRNTGRIEVAVTRVDQLPITGQGPIGAVSFTIKDDLVMGRLAGDSIVSPLGISNVRLIDERNQVIGTYPKTGNIVLEENMSTPKLPNSAGISIFPNPAQEVVHLRSKTALLEQVQIFTATGQLVKTIALNSVQEHSIPTQDFAQGLYLLQIQTSEGQFCDKIQIQH